MIKQYESNSFPAPHHLYGLNFNHKHLPEIKSYSGLTTKPIFIPGVGNFYRGMLICIPLFLARNVTSQDIRECLERSYADDSFVHVASQEDCANVCQTILGAQLDVASNVIELYVCNDFTDSESSRVILIAKLDNLGKGAATAAIQNMNIMLGFPESLGLV